MSVDYRDFTGVGGKTKPERKPEDRSREWWTRDTDKSKLSAITRALDYMAKHQSTRLMAQRQNVALYGDMPTNGYLGLGFNQSQLIPQQNRVTHNLIRMGLETLGARVCKSMPKPMYLTSGGSYKLRRRAKGLNKFTEGVFFEQKVATRGPDLFRDGGVWGCGMYDVYPRNGRVVHERVIPSEVWVDTIEGMFDQVTQMHRVYAMDKARLARMYPKSAKEIMQAPFMVDQPNVANYPSVGDLCTVRKSWHLPSGPDAKDGLFIVSTGNCVLEQKPWKRDHSTIAVFRAYTRTHDWWGEPIASILTPYQLEMNRLLWMISRSIYMMGTYKIAAGNDAHLDDAEINNLMAKIVRSDKPISYLLPPAVQPEYYAERDSITRRAFDAIGLTMDAARGEDPLGPNASGSARRIRYNIESERFALVCKNWEQLHLDIAALDIEAVQDIVGETGTYPVKVPAGRAVHTIDWNDIKIGPDDYVMQCFPISSLPQEPAGRMQTVQEWAQAGWINQRMARKLMDFPDLEAAMGLATAAEEYLEYVLDDIVDSGKWRLPEPYDDLDLATEMADEYYADGKLHGLEEDRLNMLRDWMAAVDNLKQKKAAALAPVLPLGGAPTALPTATPISGLLPQALPNQPPQPP